MYRDAILARRRDQPVRAAPSCRDMQNRNLTTMGSSPGATQGQERGEGVLCGYGDDDIAFWRFLVQSDPLCG